MFLLLLLSYYFLFCSCYLEVIEIKSKVALCLETVSHFGDMLICFSFFLLGLFLNGERGALGEEGEDIFFWEYLRTKLSDNLSLTDVVLLNAGRFRGGTVLLLLGGARTRFVGLVDSGQNLLAGVRRAGGVCVRAAWRGLRGFITTEPIMISIIE